MWHFLFRFYLGCCSKLCSPIYNIGCLVLWWRKSIWYVFYWGKNHHTNSTKIKCTGWPCPNNVDCFISRPKEKTLLLYFMFTVSCFCIFLNFIEIYSFIQYSIRRRYRRRISGRGKSVRIADFEPSHIVRRYSVDHTLDDHAEEKKENVSNCF